MLCGEGMRRRPEEGGMERHLQGQVEHPESKAFDVWKSSELRMLGKGCSACNLLRPSRFYLT